MRKGRTCSDLIINSSFFLRHLRSSVEPKSVVSLLLELENSVSVHRSGPLPLKSFAGLLKFNSTSTSGYVEMDRVGVIMCWITYSFLCVNLSPSQIQVRSRIFALAHVMRSRRLQNSADHLEVLVQALPEAKNPSVSHIFQRPLLLILLSGFNSMGDCESPDRACGNRRGLVHLSPKFCR